MSLYARFKTDSESEKNGIDIDFGDGVGIKVARAHTSNPKYVDAIKEFFGDKTKTELQSTNTEKSLKLLAEIYAKSVVLDWWGVTDENGVEMPCTKENVKKLFLDLPDLFEKIRDMASDHENFLAAKKQAFEERLKND